MSLLLRKMFLSKVVFNQKAFSLCVFLWYPQGKLSLTVPTWTRVGYHCKCSGLRTNYKKQTFSNCPPQRPHSKGCQASQLQTGIVPHILTLSYSSVQRLFFPLWTAQPGGLFQLHWLMTLKGPWRQQSSTLRPRSVGLRDKKHKPVGMCQQPLANICRLEFIPCKAPNWSSCNSQSCCCVYRNIIPLKGFRAATLPTWSWQEGMDRDPSSPSGTVVVIHGDPSTAL